MLSASDRRERYRIDPDYRLRRINSARRARRSVEIASLADVYKTHREERLRDASGRFAPDA